MPKILHEPEELMEMTDDELREVLLEDMYNKANLRETIRRTLKLVKQYKVAFEYRLEKEKEFEKTIGNLKKEINNWSE